MARPGLNGRARNDPPVAGSGLTRINRVYVTSGFPPADRRDESPTGLPAKVELSSVRPDRYEPRVKKRRRNHYGWRTRPRAEMKREMAKRGPEK